MQRDVLVFDWWVHNTDRLHRNPNLLWDAERESLVVIDHNNALDPGFDSTDFLENHLFGSQWASLTGDLVIADQYVARLCAALPTAELALQSAPEEWMWENSEFDVPTQFDRERAMAVLSRCTTPELWRTV